jgi:hypothetical protein
MAFILHRPPRAHLVWTGPQRTVARPYPPQFECNQMLSDLLRENGVEPPPASGPSNYAVPQWSPEKRQQFVGGMDPMTYAPPRSVAAQIGKIVCAGAGIAYRTN